MITDTERLDWFIENILEHKPAHYDGFPYGRFNVFWRSETNDLRSAIDKEIYRIRGQSSVNAENS